MKKLLLLLYVTIFAACVPAHYIPCPGSVTKADDTVPSMILISADPPFFGHSIDGYCVYKNGMHTGQHLRYWHNHFIEIGPQYTIWQCKRRVK